MPRIFNWKLFFIVSFILFLNIEIPNIIFAKSIILDKKIIIAPHKDFQNASSNIMVLKPKTKKIIIIPAEYNFAKEQASFRQFRDRYNVYWGIFHIMMLVALLCVH